MGTYRMHLVYIYSHPQTDCFVLSELFSVARHAERSKPGSKHVQLYVRLCFRPLVHQADHVGQGNFKEFFFFRNSSSSLCLHLHRLPECSILSKIFIYIYIYLKEFNYIFLLSDAIFVRLLTRQKNMAGRVNLCCHTINISF